MEPYRVFISSIMNRDVEDLAAERDAARAAVEHFAPITEAWAFETESASAKPLLDFYLDAVKTSDLFVLIIGQHLTTPVHEEYLTARDHGKPILVFPKHSPSRDEGAEGLLRSLNAKYDLFSNHTELRAKLRRSLGLQLLTLIRGDGNEVLRPGDRLAPLRRCLYHHTPVKIQPLLPAVQYDLFWVSSVDAGTVVFEKGSNKQRVAIPAQRIEDVLVHGDGHDPVVILDGRLQWVTLPSEWRFFPQKPPVPDPLSIGPGKAVQRDLADFPPFANPGYSLRWMNPANVPGAEVFFDENGFHWTNGGQILTCVKPGGQAAR